MSDRKRHGFVLLLVLGLLAASLVVIAVKPTLLGLDLKGGVQLTYKALPTPQTPKVDQTALNDTTSILDSRVNQFGVSNATVQTQGGNQIVVSLPDVHNLTRAENQIGSTAQLEFYDWEKNLLLPDGKFVFEELPLQNQKALLMSQGQNGGGGPGLPDTGGMPLYNAVKLASEQKPQTTNTRQLSRLGNEYFLFGAPGSKACTTAAKDRGTVPVQGEWCYLAGLSGDSSIQQLKSETLPKGVTFSQGKVLTVPQGWVVLQASNPTPSDTIKATSPQAQYFVLRDHPALSGKQISDPSEASQNGEPIVQFGFTNGGAQAFQNVTRAIAQRGEQVSIGDRMLFQHFAVSVDGQLLTVPQINFEQYPDGVIATSGRPLRGSVQGSFTTTSARQLARQLRLGQLPVKLVLLDHRS